VPRAPKMALNVASENSAPEWQLAHFDWNVPKPSCWRRVSAVLSPSRKRSIGASSETSVDSYIWIARPQNSEKLASITVNWLVVSASLDDRPGITFNAASTTWAEFHHLGWNAARIMSAYVVARPVPPATAMAPSELSSFFTSWPSSGRRASIFLPSLSQSRPAADISVLLFGGPTACDAALALFSRTATCATSPRSFATSTRAPASAAPNGLRPLNMLVARPSQKLRTLRIALIAAGVLRPVTRRVLMP